MPDKHTSQSTIDEKITMEQRDNPSFFASLRFRYGATLLVFLGAAGFLLWEEHQVHILGYLPLFLLLALCAGMHMFMHHGHGHEPAKRNQKGRE